jgi:hypothetical protein
LAGGWVFTAVYLWAQKPAGHLRGDAGWQMNAGAWQWSLVLALGVVGAVSLVLTLRWTPLALLAALALVFWWRYTQAPFVVHLLYAFAALIFMADASALAEYRRDVLVATGVAVLIWFGFAVGTWLAAGENDMPTNLPLAEAQVAIAFCGCFALAGAARFGMEHDTLTRCLWSVPAAAILAAWTAIVLLI